MNLLNDKIESIACLIEKCLSESGDDALPLDIKELADKLINESQIYNQWFVPDHVRYSLSLAVEECRFLNERLSNLPNIRDQANVDETDDHALCLYRPSAPLEGVLEMLLFALKYKQCVLHVAEGQKTILETFIKIIETIPGLRNKLIISEKPVTNPRNVFVIGKINQTMKDYLSKYKFKQNHEEGTSVLISRDPDPQQLSALANQVCMFFGRSRNSCKVLYVHEDFNLKVLQPYFDEYKEQLFHNKYFNNYEYRKSVMIINNIPYEEIGPLLVTESQLQAGYVSVLCIQRYKKEEDIADNYLSGRFKMVTKSKKSELEWGKHTLSYFCRNYEETAGDTCF
jgi:hypothetical protein